MPEACQKQEGRGIGLKPADRAAARQGKAFPAPVLPWRHLWFLLQALWELPRGLLLPVQTWPRWVLDLGNCFCSPWKCSPLLAPRLARTRSEPGGAAVQVAVLFLLIFFFLSEHCGCARVRSETRGCDRQGSGYHVCTVEEVRELPACGQTRCKLLFSEALRCSSHFTTLKGRGGHFFLLCGHR